MKNKFLKMAGIAATGMAIATNAFALSCARPSVERSFNGWADSPDTYYIGKGTLTALSPLPAVPSPGGFNQGNIDTSNLRAVYKFQGKVLGPQGDSPINHNIWVRVTCAGPWCGGFPSSGTSGIVALKQLPDLTLEYVSGACPGDIFQDDTGQVENTIKACMAAGRCPEPVLR